jgi:hypothetical protein
MTILRYISLIPGGVMSAGVGVAEQAEVARSGFLDDYDRLRPNPDFPAGPVGRRCDEQ